MKLVHRFYIFLLPVIILSAAINVLYAWYSYHDQIAAFTKITMGHSVERFVELAGNPLFKYYFDDLNHNYQESTAEDRLEIQFELEHAMQTAKISFRTPHHLALYDKNWKIVVEVFAEDAFLDKKKRVLEYNSEIKTFQTFFANNPAFDALYSDKTNERTHRIVTPIGVDLNHDNTISPSEILGYLHQEDHLPPEHSFYDAHAKTLEDLGMAVLQVVLLSLAFFWVGRNVPRPFELYTRQILKIPNREYDAQYIKKSNIYELNVLGNAIARMSEEIERKEDELIKARDLAEHSERMLRLILNTIPVRVFWKNLDGEYLGGNIQFARAAGYERVEEVIAKTDFDLCWRQNAEVFRAQDKDIIATRNPILGAELAQFDCQENLLWIEVSKVPLVDGENTVIGVLGTSHDVTTKRKAQEERDRFFEVSPDVMCIMGRDRRFKRINQALINKTSLTMAQLLETSLEAITHPDDRRITEDYVSQLLRQPNQVLKGDFRLLDVDDQPIIISWSAIAKHGQIFAVGRDVTEQKRIEWNLKLTQSSVEQAMDALYWINAEGQFVFANPSALSSLGYNSEELLSRSIMDIDTSFTQKRWAEHWDELKTQHRLQMESVHTCKDGSAHPVDIHAHYLHYQGMEYNIAFVRDITTRKEAEKNLQDYADNLEDMVQRKTRELAHAERLASLGTFSAGMAHEINNPNSFIAGNIDFLKQFWQLSRPILANNSAEDKTGRVGAFLNDVDETLDGMLDGSKRISKIIDSLKAYSRGGMETDKVECRLAEPVQDAENLLIHRLKKGFSLTVDVPPHLVIVCDRQQMGQVFVNLLNNSMDAMETMSRTKEKRMAISAHQVDDHIWIRVKDNGPGIPPEAIGKVFDPFYTSKGKTKGTGLGLSIVHGIIQDHLGQITVYSSSRPDEDTEFLIILPSQKLYQTIQLRKSKS